MKKKKILVIVSLIMTLMTVLSACSSKSFYKDENSASKADYGGWNEEVQETDKEMGIPEEKPSLDSSSTGYGAAVGGAIVNTEEASALQTQDKIIRTFYMDMETQEFDSLITDLNAEIGRLGGYVETSNISGRSIYSSGEMRYAGITARIPKAKADEFVNSVNEKANVVNKKESTENVTLQYTDIQSRKKALEIEQERLFELLEKAESMENIVTLESRLSDIRYELQNYETTLRTYDNKVEYSTVSLTIREVEKLTPVVEEARPTVATRIKNGFGDTIYRLSEGTKDFVVWFIVNLPYLLIWAAIITASVLIGKRILKRRRSNNSQNPPANPPMNPPEGPSAPPAQR
ncbi:hypothetical protein HNQ56_001041 [Anaerotaenia torta]|uniref:DUF4349 domain-containing protein n=1 Tax=Anaerotaenia torta TaxID=433293 RepID=UPI003D1AB4FD